MYPGRLSDEIETTEWLICMARNSSAAGRLDGVCAIVIKLKYERLVERIQLLRPRPAGPSHDAEHRNARER
jgi:hypothetical protein